MFSGLTREFVQDVFDIRIKPFIASRMVPGDESDNRLRRTQGSFVVLRTVPWEPKYFSSECREFRDEVVLFEHHFGGPPIKFEKPFHVVARSKAYVSFVTGLSSHVLNQNPWMYQPGWTRWGGSAVLKPAGANVALIVAYSGGTAVQDYNVARDALLVIAKECNKDYDIELEENEDFMWVGGQPPSAERLRGFDDGERIHIFEG